MTVNQCSVSFKIEQLKQKLKEYEDKNLVHTISPQKQADINR